MSTSRQQQVEQLKQQGNDCVKAGNYSEGVIHYTHAIQQDKTNHLLYSNRSLAFLKLDQYYYALEDAKEAIKLQPNWPKGFFRKGEVEFKVGQYTASLISYGQAYLLDPTNQDVKAAIERTNKELAHNRKKNARQPWQFTGAGFVIGLLIVVADQLLTKKPSINYIILQILMVLIFAGLGFLAFKIYRYLQDSEKRSLLEPPVDILGEMSGKKSDDINTDEDKQSNSKQSEVRHRKGGAAAGKQRYKKGKS